MKSKNTLPFFFHSDLMHDRWDISDGGETDEERQHH